MPSTPSSRLAAHYKRVGARFQVLDRTTDYAQLVVPTGNDGQPIHRWFQFKEAYSHQLLARLLKDSAWDSERAISLLDPFAGSGTSLVSALEFGGGELPVRATGVERNPVLKVVAEAKATAMVGGCDLADRLYEAGRSMDEDYEQVLAGSELLTTPSPTLNNTQYFSKIHSRALLALGEAASLCEDELVRPMLQTAVAASVEGSGKLRRDGRALRYVPARVPAHPKDLVTANVARMVDDIRGLPDRPGSTATVIDGDARKMPNAVGSELFEWVVFSPPYPNNIDYTEVYKLEAWVLGFFSSAEGMREQRLSTLRSHPSILFPDSYEYAGSPVAAEVEALVAPLVEAVPSDRYSRGREQLVRGYVDDMASVLAQARTRIDAEGHLALVVGNSLHGTGDAQFVIASDLLLAALGSMAGFEVNEIRVARRLKRRASDDPHLRESVVVMRPV